MEVEKVERKNDDHDDYDDDHDDYDDGDGDVRRWTVMDEDDVCMNLNLLRGVACSVGTRGLEIILASPTVHVPVASMEKAEGDMRTWIEMGDK